MVFLQDVLEDAHQCKRRAGSHLALVFHGGELLSQVDGLGDGGERLVFLLQVDLLGLSLQLVCVALKDESVVGQTLEAFLVVLTLNVQSLKLYRLLADIVRGLAHRHLRGLQVIQKLAGGAYTFRILGEGGVLLDTLHFRIPRFLLLLRIRSRTYGLRLHRANCVMGIDEQIQDLPAAVVNHQLALVEHVTDEKVVIFTKKLGERSLLLGKRKLRIIDVGLELLRQPADLPIQGWAYLADDLSVVKVVVQPRRDLLVVELGEDVDILAQKALHDLRHLVYLDFRLGDVLPV